MVAGLFFFRYSGRMKQHITSITLLLALSACATITGEKEQDISITTNPAGAQCILTNGQESWTLEKTPGTVAIPRAFQTLTVKCTLAGYQPVSAKLEPKTRGRAYGNLALGGIPAVVDAGTGAGYAYEPDTVSLPFSAPLHP